MSAYQWFQEKWVHRVRQFGLRAACAQAVRAALRPVVEVKRDLVMIIPNHEPRPVELPGIRPMAAEDVEAAAERGELDARQRALLLGFLGEGSRGFLAEVDGRLAGYAFVQPMGRYPFARTGRLEIPERMMVLKNLLVSPAFRGRSLGKRLNQVRIASIPAGWTPVAFVMTENRFAIRNLKMFGFEETLIVSRATWFKRWTRQNVRLVCGGERSQRLIAGLEPS